MGKREIINTFHTINDHRTNLTLVPLLPYIDGFKQILNKQSVTEMDNIICGRWSVSQIIQVKKKCIQKF